MRKDHVITIRLNQDEYETAWKLADKKNAKLSEMVRVVLREFLTRSPEYKGESLQEIRGIHRQLTGIGRNLNQITKAIHQGKIPTQSALSEQVTLLQQGTKNTQRLVASMIETTQRRHTKTVTLDWNAHGKK